MTEPPEVAKFPVCAICGKPCSLQDCVTDAAGKAVHKSCYREAIIRGSDSL
jgi:hypothetical protein